MIGNSLVMPHVFPYISLNNLIYFSLIYFRGTPFFSKTYFITSLGTLAYAFCFFIN